VLTNPDPRDPVLEHSVCSHLVPGRDARGLVSAIARPGSCSRCSDPIRCRRWPRESLVSRGRRCVRALSLKERPGRRKTGRSSAAAMRPAVCIGTLGRPKPMRSNISKRGKFCVHAIDATRDLSVDICLKALCHDRVCVGRESRDRDIRHIVVRRADRTRHASLFWTHGLTGSRAQAGLTASRCSGIVD